MADRGRQIPAAFPKLTVRGLKTRALRVPMRRPLGTSGGTITHAPLVLLDLETEEGVPGRAYLFGYSDLGARALRHLRAGLREGARRRGRAGRDREEARRPLHADRPRRAPRHRDVGARRGPLGRAGPRDGAAA